ncbi:MAG: hypothetical protein Aurels2KO_44950 [Aureliella sp.]
MDVHFFGPAERQLLGVSYPPRRPSSHTDTPARCVLICPPLGQEYVRSYWALGLVAGQLARKGIHAMRFDYRGHGDSFASTEQVCSLEEWKSDIKEAIQQAKRFSGAESVMLLGLRAGAGLAAEVASERDDVNALVAWEPVTNGSSYLAMLRKVHALMLDLWYQPIATPNDDKKEELLGQQYDRSLIDELEKWQIDLATTLVPQLIVNPSTAVGNAEEDASPWQRIVKTNDKDSWNKLIDLEAAWLRPQTSQTVINTIVEMFDRLTRLDMLRPVREHAGHPAEHASNETDQAKESLR